MRFGAVFRNRKPSVRFAAVFRCDFYGAVRCYFMSYDAVRCYLMSYHAVGCSFLISSSLRWGAVNCTEPHWTVRKKYPVKNPDDTSLLQDTRLGSLACSTTDPLSIEVGSGGLSSRRISVIVLLNYVLVASLLEESLCLANWTIYNNWTMFNNWTMSNNWTHVPSFLINSNFHGCLWNLLRYTYYCSQNETSTERWTCFSMFPRLFFTLRVTYEYEYVRARYQVYSTEHICMYVNIKK